MPELADIFRRYGPEYREKYQDKMLPSHKRAMRDIESCRTEFFGGEVYQCKDCGRPHYAYHSCKNRHCPKCMNAAADEWIQTQTQRLLPVPYFLVTFTLPEECRQVARSNQKTVYECFFRTSAAALQKLAYDPKYVGAKIGMTGVLQTWTRENIYHPHIHYIVPAGGLAADGKSWGPARYSNFLVHAKPLAIIFKEKFRQEMIKNGLNKHIHTKAWTKEWVIDCEPVGNGQYAVKYLAPYVYRIAITNNRILNIDDDIVRFLCKNSDTGKWEPKNLPALEFIRRFLQHVLPKGFRKVRHYGLLHPANRKQLLDLKASLESQNDTDSTDESPGQHEEQSNDERKDPARCAYCGGELIYIDKILPAKRFPP